jgi:hypothetical protein
MKEIHEMLGKTDENIFRNLMIDVCAAADVWLDSLCLSESRMCGGSEDLIDAVIELRNYQQMRQKNSGNQIPQD